MLKGKIAVVTGGSRGIGQAICLELAAQGADIAFIYAGTTRPPRANARSVERFGRPGRKIQMRYCRYAGGTGNIRSHFLLILVRSIS